MPIKDPILRYALYFTPPRQDPLTVAASRWLGRDAFGDDSPFPLGCGIFTQDALWALTEEPRRYGFHATLKAPFALTPGRTEDELMAAVETFAAETTAFDIPSVAIGRLGSFFALVPTAEHVPLQDFAAETVRRFEPFRAAPSSADLARRKPDELPPRQRDNLMTWGYPYVFEEFQFHMTLTGRVPEEKAPAMAALLEETFAPFTGKPLTIGALALFVEETRGAPFAVHSLLPLRSASSRKIA